MKFYYVNLISLVLLGMVYLVGTLFLVWFLSWLKRHRKNVLPILLPLALLIYSVPVSEELWVAWNFGRLCKKDAGLFVYKTVEVDGFYNAASELLEVHVPIPEQTARYYDKQGYRFYELSLVDMKGGQNRIVRYEKINGDWTASVIDRPTSRYHFQRTRSHTPVSYKIKLFEYLVTDEIEKQVLARERTYARQAPWFYIGLDRPTKFCSVSGDYGEKIHATLYDLVLKSPGRR